MNLQLRSNWNFIVILAVAVIFSSFTLWLLEESWIKYPLFIIEIGIIIIIYLILNNYVFNIKSHRSIDFIFRYLKIPQLNIYIDLLLVILSFILVLLNIFHINGILSLPHLILAFLCVSFLSGFAILNIFNLHQYLSRLEYIVISYISSFILSGFVTLALLYINENTRAAIIPILFMSVGIISILQRKRCKNKIIHSHTANNFKRPPSLCNNVDVLAISISLIFYITFFCLVYPNFTLIPSNDIARHYDWSVVLSRTHDLYTGFNYLLFHSFEATLYVLSGFSQTINSFQTIQVTLNIFIPLAVYVFAKRYLANIDKRIPALATIFYSVLSNFSYFDFVRLKLLNNINNPLDMLRNTAQNTLDGTINFMQPFPWFVPLSISFVIFVVAILFLRINVVSKPRFILFYSTLILAMYLIHITDALVFVIFLAIYSILFGGNRGSLRLNDALLSSLIGLTISSVFFYYISFLWSNPLMHNIININSYLPILLSILITFISLFYLKYKKDLIKFISYRNRNYLKSVLNIKSKKFYIYLSYILIFAYLFSLLTWMLSDYKTSSFEILGISPWYVYPLMLGIVGLLAILGIRYLNEILPISKQIIILLFAILFFFVIGRLISFINLNFFFTGYWEKRLIQFIFLFACIFAPISLIKFRDQIQIKFNSMQLKNLRATALLITIISGIVISGFSSLALQTNFWITISNNNIFKVTDQELTALEYLKDILQNDPRAFTISPSHYSDNVLNFATPVYHFALPEAFTSAKYPEIPLFVLAWHNLSHAYIYIHNTRDFDALNHARDSWIENYLFKTLPIIFENKMVTIYNATKVSFPLPHSNTVMAVPIERFDNSWMPIQDLLSKSDSNYTVNYYDDPNIFRSKNIILAFDPSVHNNFSELFASNTHPMNWNIISGFWSHSPLGLNGGKFEGSIKNSPKNIILSPVYSKNTASNISTSFKISALDKNVLNFASIIYSWINPDNYRNAGINILNNNIYLYFAKVTDGKVSYFPSWPGKKIDVQFIPSSIYNATLYLRDNNSQELNLNNKSSIYENKTNELGYIGLSYQNIHNISFHSFNINESNKINNQDLLASYLSFVKSGGNLIVYNTNGHGSLFKTIFNSSISSYNSPEDPAAIFNGPFPNLLNSSISSYNSPEDPAALFNGPFPNLLNSSISSYNSPEDPAAIFNGPFPNLLNSSISSYNSPEDPAAIFNGPFPNLLNSSISSYNSPEDPAAIFNGPFPNPTSIGGSLNFSKNINSKVIDVPKSNNPFDLLNTSSISHTNASLYSNSIYIIKKSLGHGNVTYIDFSPLIAKHNSMPFNLSNTDLGKKLSSINSIENINHSSPTIKNIFNKIVASFKDIIGSGKVKVNSSSIIFPGNFQSTGLKVVTDKNKIEYFDNISKLNIINYHDVLLSGNSTRIYVTSGKGLYSDIYLSKNNSNSGTTYRLEFPLEKNISNIIVSGIANNKSFSISNASNIDIKSSSPIHLLARQPHIQVYGNTNITQLQSNLSYIKTGYLPSKDFSFLGNLSLSIYLSDVYSLANGFSIEKPSEFLNHHMNYDYLTGLIPNTFTSFNILFLIPLAIVIIFILIERKKYDHVV